MKMTRRPPATAMLTMAGRLSGLSGATYTIPGEYSMPPTRAWGHSTGEEAGSGHRAVQGSSPRLAMNWLWGRRRERAPERKTITGCQNRVEDVWGPGDGSGWLRAGHPHRWEAAHSLTQD